MKLIPINSFVDVIVDGVTYKATIEGSFVDTTSELKYVVELCSHEWTKSGMFIRLLVVDPAWIKIIKEY